MSPACQADPGVAEGSRRTACGAYCTAPAKAEGAESITADAEMAGSLRAVPALPEGTG